MTESRAYCVNGHDVGPCTCVADPFMGGMCNACLDATRDCDVCNPRQNAGPFEWLFIAAYGIAASIAAVLVLVSFFHLALR
jgi:hypothetical protein